MSVAVHFSPPITGKTRSFPKSAPPVKPPPTNQRIFPVYPEIRTTKTRWLRKSPYLIVRAIEQSRDTTESEFESESNPPLEESGIEDKKEEVEINAIGAEIKAAMEQRKAKEEEKGKNEFLSGVAEEVREIEWPAFQKVIGTTGVVLGVIAGSSIVLLTVNFILAELSDRVFIGKGVQDFFS